MAGWNRDGWASICGYTLVTEFRLGRKASIERGWNNEPCHSETLLHIAFKEILKTDLKTKWAQSGCIVSKITAWIQAYALGNHYQKRKILPIGSPNTDQCRPTILTQKCSQVSKCISSVHTCFSQCDYFFQDSMHFSDLRQFNNTYFSYKVLTPECNFHIKCNLTASSSSPPSSFLHCRLRAEEWLAQGLALP